MSGFLALLDDVAALAKLAAAQVDDVALQAAKAGSQAVGVVVDDAAVTPKYVAGLPAARELPIVWQIARGSVFNKIVILLPAALLLDAFLPWLLTPLLMLGGAYLCFEGAEKVWHWIVPHEPESEAQQAETLDAAHLEKQRVAGAVKTDFILSAEIMTIALAAIDADSVVIQGLILAAVGIGVTALVYGVVALLVKADDLGLRMSQKGRLAPTRALGRGIVKGMPAFMTAIATVGTAAMLWVGGGIFLHGLHVLGWHAPADAIHHLSEAVAGPGDGGFLGWIVTAALDGLIGLALGLALIPVVSAALGLFGAKDAAH